MKHSALSSLGRRTTEPPISWLMKTALEHPGIISLAAGFTDQQTLPVNDAREALNEILGHSATGRVALQYGSTAGDPALRRLTAEALRLADAAPLSSSLYAPERLLLTHGSQQLLYLITEALCDPGDLVLVEDPSYFVFLGIMQSHGLTSRGIRMEADGLSLEHLESALKALTRTGDIQRVKLLYLVSYYQNPSGITTTFAKKAAALGLLRKYEKAAGHPIYLLEDAAYRGLRFAGQPDVPSALATGKLASRVIYTSTYSKPFATGVRVGYGLLPSELFLPVERIKGNHDFGTSHLLQKLLACTLESGRFARHLAMLQQRYQAKAMVMAEAIRAHWPADVQWRMPKGGLYIWARLPGGRKTGPRAALCRAALRQKVLYVPGIFCYADDPTRAKPDTEMRLSFGHATEANMCEGIRRLGAVLQAGH
jgi:2-aminoadipate transaminase